MTSSNTEQKAKRLSDYKAIVTVWPPPTNSPMRAFLFSLITAAQSKVIDARLQKILYDASRYLDS